MSVSTCSILSIGRGLVKTDYYIGDTDLPHVSKCRDLGVMITQDLSPAVHINEITAKAHQRANCILQCFVSKDISLLLLLLLLLLLSVHLYSALSLVLCATSRLVD